MIKNLYYCLVQVIFLILISLFFGLIACSVEKETINLSDLPDKVDTQSNFSPLHTPKKTDIEPYVTLKYNEKLIKILEVNLFDTAIPGQILLIQSFTHPQWVIQIWVIAYDHVKQKYQIIWKTNLNNINGLKDIQLELMDITGDHDKEIMIKILDNDLMEFMYLFKRYANNTQFYPIFELNTPGQLTIQQKERPSSYDEYLIQGESFDIIHRKLNIEKEKNIEYISLYQWNFSDKYYRLISTEQKTINLHSSELATLFQKKEDKIYSFLDGVWKYKTNSIQKKYLQLDLNQKKISIFYNQSIESYRITYLKIQPNRYSFYLIIYNTIIPTDKRRLSIQIYNTDTINVITNSRLLRGRFSRQKISPDLSSSPSLEGLYIDQDEQLIYEFKNYYITQKNQDNIIQKKGTYIVLPLNEDFLIEWQWKDKSKELFSAQYKEDKWYLRPQDSLINLNFQKKYSIILNEIKENSSN